MRTVEWGWKPGYGYSTGTSIPDEWAGGVSEYLEYVGGYGDRGIARPATSTWQCDYCGTSHWVKKEELQCKQCGAPREI